MSYEAGWHKLDSPASRAVGIFFFFQFMKIFEDFYGVKG